MNRPEFVYSLASYWILIIGITQNAEAQPQDLQWQDDRTSTVVVTPTQSGTLYEFVSDRSSRAAYFVFLSHEGDISSAGKAIAGSASTKFRAAGEHDYREVPRYLLYYYKVSSKEPDHYRIDGPYKTDGLVLTSAQRINELGVYEVDNKVGFDPSNTVSSVEAIRRIMRAGGNATAKYEVLTKLGLLVTTDEDAARKKVADITRKNLKLQSEIENIRRSMDLGVVASAPSRQMMKNITRVTLRHLPRGDLYEFHDAGSLSPILSLLIENPASNGSRKVVLAHEDPILYGPDYAYNYPWNAGRSGALQYRATEYSIEAVDELPRLIGTNGIDGAKLSGTPDSQFLPGYYHEGRQKCQSDCIIRSPVDRTLEPEEALRELTAAHPELSSLLVKEGVFVAADFTRRKTLTAEISELKNSNISLNSENEKLKKEVEVLNARIQELQTGAGLIPLDPNLMTNLNRGLQNMLGEKSDRIRDLILRDGRSNQNLYLRKSVDY